MATELRIDQIVDGCRAMIAGDLDLTAEPRVRKGLFEALSQRPDKLVLDLSDVTFIDSSGLRVLLACRNRCEETGTHLYLAGVGPEIERTLHVANLRNFFDYEAAS